MTNADDTRDNVTHMSAAHLPARDDRDWVTSTELIDTAGITYRQLDYWCRTNLLTPIDAATPGSGWMRRFPEDQVDRATRIRQLLAAGISLQTIRAVIDQVLTTGRVDIGDITITVQPSGDAA